MIYTITLNPSLDKTLEATGLAPEVINRAQIVRFDLGGKGINVSRALRNLGLESVAMGFLGGATGALFQKGLAELGIATDFVAVAGETRTNLTIYDRQRDVLVKLNEPGPAIGPEDVAALLAKIRGRAKLGDIWVMAGNLPPGAPDDLYATLIAAVQRSGGRAILDASGAPLRLGCAAAPYLVKPNRLEAEQLLGRRLTDQVALRDALRAMLQMGVMVAVISLAAEGAVIADAKVAFWARPPAVIARSNIGAGDSLLAGWVWGLVKEWPLAEVIRWAVAAGTAAAMEEGTGVCILARTEELCRDVRVARF